MDAADAAAIADLDHSRVFAGQLMKRDNKSHPTGVLQCICCSVFVRSVVFTPASVERIRRCCLYHQHANRMVSSSVGVFLFFLRNYVYDCGYTCNRTSFEFLFGTHIRLQLYIKTDACSDWVEYTFCKYCFVSRVFAFVECQQTSLISCDRGYGRALTFALARLSCHYCNFDV